MKKGRDEAYIRTLMSGLFIISAICNQGSCIHGQQLSTSKDGSAAAMDSKDKQLSPSAGINPVLLTLRFAFVIGLMPTIGQKITV